MAEVYKLLHNFNKNRIICTLCCQLDMKYTPLTDECHEYQEEENIYKKDTMELKVAT